MSPVNETSYIVFDTESVVDGALLSRVQYPGENLSPEEAITRYEKELQAASSRPDRRPFLPVPFHVPVAIAIARVGGDYTLREFSCLDAPRFDPRAMVELFWKGVQAYTGAVLVDFNGRGFDLPLLTLSAYRFGLSCPQYFDDKDRFGFRYRFTDKHLDLQDWMTEYGAYRLNGGLNLLAKVLGKPGKMETKGDQVQDMHRRGELQEINDYCLFDVLDTYFVFLRTRLLAGKIRPEEEERIEAEAKKWIESRSETVPALKTYLSGWSDRSREPFAE